MHRWNRFLAALLVLVMLAGSMPGVARALTARPPVPDLMSLADLLAGLPNANDLPFPNPLAAVNAALQPPDMAGGQAPGLDLMQSAGLNTTGIPTGMPGSPGAAPQAGTPGAPDPLAHPVDLATGSLRLQATDLAFPGNGFGFSLERRYDSREPQDGPLGFGWRLNLGGQLRMYDGYHIAEFRPDGSTARYSFVKDDPNGGVYEFDGDDLINYDLSKGHYEQAGDGSVLERISATEYRVTRKDGTAFTYAGYSAPWRTNQPVVAGRLTAISDRSGNSQRLSYDAQGHFVKVTDTAGRSIEFGWSGGRIVTARLAG